jgi:hypothetical protein
VATLRACAATALLACLVLVGCRETPPDPPRVAAAPTQDPRAEGEAAARRGDWQMAVTHYAAAVAKQPDDVLLRFAYGSALSQLDRRDETIEQFRWVVEHGEPARPEVAAARQWLQQARALPTAARARDDAATSTDGAAAPTPSPPPAPGAPAGPTGQITGKTGWPGVDQEQRVSVRLRLHGESPATAVARQRFSVRLGVPFTISHLPPGPYRLVGEAKGMTLWDVPVTVEAGQATTVDLSPLNSAVPAGRFPPPA